MKFLLPAILLIASAVADVSHLQNTYLPPGGHGNHHHHPTEYAEQTNEAPQFIATNTYTSEHFAEQSNSLEPEASQPEAQLFSAADLSNLKDENIYVDVQSSAPAVAVETTNHEEVAYQQPAQNYEATQYQEEHQPTAQDIVSETYGSSNVYNNVPQQAPFGLADQHAAHQYDAASSSSGIDTQYGSNGGYVY